MIQPDQQMLSAIAGGAAKEIDEKLGGYNSMPPNWQEITQSEFLWWFNGYHKHIHRQVKLPSVGYPGVRDMKGTRDAIGEVKEMFCDVNMWVAPDFSGVGFIQHYNGQATRSTEDAFFAQFFRWIYCEHDYETVVSRMSYWVGTCRKCGFTSTIDSSG